MTTPIFVEVDPADGHIVIPSTDAMYQRSATAVKTTGNQTIAGVKTYSSPPAITNAPVNPTDASNKAYIDGLVAAKIAKTFYVHTATGSPLVYAGRTTLPLVAGQPVEWMSPGATLPTGLNAPQPGDKVWLETAADVVIA